MSISEKINDVFYPSGIKCVICGDDIPQGVRYPICRHCKPERNLTFCVCCGRNMLNGSQRCTHCKDSKWNFSYARAPFVYKDDVRKIVHRLKYGNGRYIAKEIAVYLADTYFEQGLMSDIITFVPMFSAKKRQRGYNQAEELAKELGRAVECEVEELLVKTVNTKSNARQSAAQRALSVKNSIALKDGTDIAGKSVLLIDDVFTTGATANECAKALVGGGANSVIVLTFATAVQNEMPTGKATLSEMLTKVGND